MYIFATFEHSIDLELAISFLGKSGLAKDNVLAIPLQNKMSDKIMVDTIHQSDGASLFDGITALGTVFMLLGAIYGFVLKWGPIIWAIIGAFTGVFLGLLLDLLIGKKKGRKLKTGQKNAEVILLINCPAEKAAAVEQLLWKHKSLGVGRFDR